MVLRSGYDTQAVIPAAYDNNSDTIYYSYTSNLPGAVTYTPNVTYGNNLTFTGVSVGLEGTYYLQVIAAQNADAKVNTTENITIYINRLPTVSATFPSNPITKTPYTNTADVVVA